MAGYFIFHIHSGVHRFFKVGTAERALLIHGLRLRKDVVGKLLHPAQAKFCLRRVNLEEDKYGLMPSEISGGMQKRVAIARAIALQPKYLFCDEPNSGLDPRTSLVIDRLIAELTREFGMTTIVNSHDMNSIMEIGDHIVFIEHGAKVWQGSRTDILHADCQELDDFVFASDLFKRIKSAKTQ